MFERLTPTAREAVRAAQQIAAGQGAEEVRPQHLLMAVLEAGDDGAEVLAELGADPAGLRTALTDGLSRYPEGLDAADAEALRTLGIDLDEVSQRISADLTAPSRKGLPHMSRGTKKALELSLREALNLKHSWIGTEHVLLGLVRGGDRTVLDVLTGGGLDPRRIRDVVRDRTRRAG